MMPEMSGVELHQWLVLTYPELAPRVVFITGGVFTPAAREHLAKFDNVRVVACRDRRWPGAPTPSPPLLRGYRPRDMIAGSARPIMADAAALEQF